MPQPNVAGTVPWKDGRFEAGVADIRAACGVPDHSRDDDVFIGMLLESFKWDREKVIDERECELATRAKKLDAAHASRTAELEARMRRLSSKEQQLIDREMQLASREKQLLQKATHQPRQPRRMQRPSHALRCLIHRTGTL